MKDDEQAGEDEQGDDRQKEEENAEDEKIDEEEDNESADNKQTEADEMDKIISTSAPVQDEEKKSEMEAVSTIAADGNPRPSSRQSSGR